MLHHACSSRLLSFVVCLLCTCVVVNRKISYLFCYWYLLHYWRHPRSSTVIFSTTDDLYDRQPSLLTTSLGENDICRPWEVGGGDASMKTLIFQISTLSRLTRTRRWQVKGIIAPPRACTSLLLPFFVHSAPYSMSSTARYLICFCCRHLFHD